MAGLNVRHVHSKDLREETTSLHNGKKPYSRWVSLFDFNNVLYFSVFSEKNAHFEAVCRLCRSLYGFLLLIKKWGCIDGLQFLLNKFLQLLSRLREISVRTQCATFSVFSEKNAHFEAVCRLCRSLYGFLLLIKKWGCIDGLQFLLNKFLQFLSRLREISVRTQCATFSVFLEKNAHFEAVCRLCRSLYGFSFVNKKMGLH